MGLINPIIFVRVQDAFLLILYDILRSTEKEVPIAFTKWKEKCNLSVFIWFIFLFFIFSGSHWSEEKLDTSVFHPQAVSDKRDAMLRGLWYMFYVWSKQFLIFSSPFSFNYALPNWDIQANILSDRWPTAYRSMATSLFKYLCGEIIFWQFIQNLSK